MLFRSRTIGAIWDLIDLNDDGESIAESFARVWKATANGRSRSMKDFYQRLESAGFERERLDLAWLLNFRVPR